MDDWRRQPCVLCGENTEERVAAEWCHQDCHDAAVDELRHDYQEEPA